MTAFKHDQDGTPSWSCMTYTSAEYTVETSWWWAEEMPQTCRIS